MVGYAWAGMANTIPVRTTTIATIRLWTLMRRGGTVSLVNLDDGLVDVVLLVCLACVVVAGGVNRARDVFAIPAFADDDENVVHFARHQPTLPGVPIGTCTPTQLHGVQVRHATSAHCCSGLSGGAHGGVPGPGYRNRTDLADSLPFTVRTLADIEHGVRKASPGTYAMLENKLAWAPGGID